VNLKTTLERSTPTRAQWDAWTHHQTSLAGLAYHDLRRELRTGSQDRKDELLGALVRLAQADPGAFGVLAACLLPGLCHRAARYARSLDHQEALAVMVAALYESTARYDLEPHSRFVAEKLLARPIRRLRRTVGAHRTWSAHLHESDIGSYMTDLELSPHALLASAVEAGVLTQHDARLIFDTRIAGHGLPEAARRPSPAGRTGGRGHLSGHALHRRGSRLARLLARAPAGRARDRPPPGRTPDPGPAPAVADRANCPSDRTRGRGP
jgi:hypothetical protein